MGLVVRWLFKGTSVDAISAGALSAGLLLWPALFVGLPWHRARRSWQIPAIYLTFVACGAALARVGWSTGEILRLLGGQSASQVVVSTIRGLFLSFLIASALAAFTVGIARQLLHSRVQTTEDENYWPEDVSRQDVARPYTAPIDIEISPTPGQARFNNTVTLGSLLIALVAVATRGGRRH
jgi:hypothetical protein